MIEWDVAIVGAGPAGSAAARECTRRGLKTVILEKKRIPRHKTCSGILVPDSINALSEQFGDMPQDVLAFPAQVTAMRMHFPDGHTGDVPIHGLMIRRDRLDAWLCKASQAAVLDETNMQSFAERSDSVDLLCIKSNGERLQVRSKVVIAADGGASRMVKQIDPPLMAKLTWHVALQETYACKGHLEPGLFHFFAFPEISLYSSAYVKDNLLVMEVVVRLEDKAALAMARFKEHLWRRIGIEQARLVRRLGCRVTYAAPRGLFCFGTERILVSGEASGLLNLFGEGISSALASGRIAGRVSFSSIREGMSPGRLYRQEIEGEKRKTISTFNYKTLLFREGGAFNFKKGLQLQNWRDRIRFTGDLLKWLLKLTA